MKYIEVETYAELSKLGADIIADVIKSKSNPVLGLATGSSPVGIYQNLVAMNILMFVASFVASEKFGVDLKDYLGLHFFMSEFVLRTYAP